MAYLHDHAGVSPVGHTSALGSSHHPTATPWPESHGNTMKTAPWTFYYKNMDLLFAKLAVCFAVAIAFLTVFLLAICCDKFKRVRERLLRKSKWGFVPSACLSETWNVPQADAPVADADRCSPPADDPACAPGGPVPTADADCHGNQAFLSWHHYWLSGGKKAELGKSENHDKNVVLVKVSESDSGN